MGSFIGSEASTTLLERHGIKSVKSITVHSEKDLESIGKRLGYPVAMKVVSKDIIHKTEARAVFTRVHNLEDARQVFKDIHSNVKAYAPKARIEGVLVQQHAPGFELIVGGRIDPQFGPVVLVGAGGVFSEVLKDTSVRLAPITRDDALEMVKELKAAEVLKGYRGEKPANIRAIVDVLLKVSALMEKGGVEELDVNPLMASEKGAVCVDARVIKK